MKNLERKEIWKRITATAYGPQSFYPSSNDDFILAKSWPNCFTYSYNHAPIISVKTPSRRRLKDTFTIVEFYHLLLNSPSSILYEHQLTLPRRPNPFPNHHPSTTLKFISTTSYSFKFSFQSLDSDNSHPPPPSSATSLKSLPSLPYTYKCEHITLTYKSMLISPKTR